MFCLSHICCYQRRSASKCLSSFSHPDTQCNRPTSMVRLTRRRSPRWAWTSLTYGATSVTSQALTRMVMKSTSTERGTRRTCWAGWHRDRQGKRRKKPLWSTTTPSPPRLWKSPPIPKFNPSHIVGWKMQSPKLKISPQRLCAVHTCLLKLGRTRKNQIMWRSQLKFRVLVIWITVKISVFLV